MGTALTVEEKIQKLQDILNEYVFFLHIYSSVTIEKEIKTSKMITTAYFKYDIKTEEQVLDDKILTVKIKPTPYIKVTYKGTKKDWYDYCSIEFPLEDIDVRIQHYKYKVQAAKKRLEKSVAD